MIFPFADVWAESVRLEAGTLFPDCFEFVWLDLIGMK